MTRTIRRAALICGAAALLLGWAGAPVAAAAKFSWKWDGNEGATTWRAFKDDDAYITVKGKARQRARDDNNLYVRVVWESLRCDAGQNTCYSVGAGGVINVGSTEGQEWHQRRSWNSKDMTRRSGMPWAASEAFDPDAALMRVKVFICGARTLLPDKCSKPRYDYHEIAPNA